MEYNHYITEQGKIHIYFLPQPTDVYNKTSNQLNTKSKKSNI